MKKVNFKNALMALVFAMAFLIVGTQESNAQAVTTLTGALPTSGVNFKPSAQVQPILQEKIGSLKTALQGLAPGTAIYNATFIQARYYDGILTEINAGKTVQEAIQTGLSYAITPSGNFGQTSPLSRSQMMLMMQDAVNLLKA